MEIDRLPVKILIERIGVEAPGDLVRRLGILGHDEEQRLPAAFFPFLPGFLPAGVAQHQMVLIFYRGVLSGLLDERLTPTDDGRLDDSRIHRLAQRRVADHMLEDVAVVVLGRGGEVELGDQAAAGPLMDRVMKPGDRLVPGGPRVPDVMGLVVHEHDALVGGDPFPEGLSGIEGLRF